MVKAYSRCVSVAGADGADQIAVVVDGELRVEAAVEADEVASRARSSSILAKICASVRTYPPGWPGSA